MRPHTSIGRLVVAVALCGVAFASLRAASAAWADACLTAAIALMTLAVVAASCTRDRRRAYWAGFAIGGWLYLILSCGPLCESSIGPRLMTTAMLDLANEHVARPQPMVETQAGDRQLGWQTDFAAQAAEANAAMRWYESLGLGRDFYGWGSAARLHSSVEFRRIGHSWFAPLIGGLVGLAAVRFHDTRSRGGDPS